MANFPVHTFDTAPPASRDLLKQTEENFGFLPNLIGVMASSPAITEAYLTLSGIFSKSGFTDTEQQIILLTVSHYHDCQYCMAAHSAIADMQSIDPQLVDALRNDTEISDPKLQALREFTRLLIDNRGWVSQDDIQTFLNAGYQESHILTIFVGIAQKILSNFTNHVANTPLDDAFLPVKWSKI